MSGIIKALGNIYKKSVYNSLAKYGLRYEDVIIAENPDVQRALKYIPKEEYVNRQRRIRRAIDLNFKHEYLPKDIQAVQEPGKKYLEPLMTRFSALREEREKLI